MLGKLAPRLVLVCLTAAPPDLPAPLRLVRAARPVEVLFVVEFLPAVFAGLDCRVTAFIVRHADDFHFDTVSFLDHCLQQLICFEKLAVKLLVLVYESLVFRVLFLDLERHFPLKLFLLSDGTREKLVEHFRLLTEGISFIRQQGHLTLKVFDRQSCLFRLRA